jgi:hypothetical protein
MERSGRAVFREGGREVERGSRVCKEVHWSFASLRMTKDDETFMLK